MRWARFDNVSGATTPIGETPAAAEQAQAPAQLPETPGTFLSVSVTAVAPPHDTWKAPVTSVFRRTTNGWHLVGLERDEE